MINFGKVAYDRLNSLQQNKRVEYCFNSKILHYNVSENNNDFYITLKANNDVFFDISCDNNIDLKIYNDEQLCMAKNSITNDIFHLKILKLSKLKFVVDCQSDTSITIKIVGNFEYKDDSVINLYSFTNMSVIASVNDNTFSLYTGTTANDAIDNYNNNICTTYSGKLLDIEYIDELKIMYQNGDNICIKGSTLNTIDNLQFSKGVMFKCDYLNTAFAIAYIKHGTLNIRLYDSSLNEINTHLNISIKGINNIVDIKCIDNLVDDNTYFVLTDNNYNNYIVLFNYPNNGLITSINNVIGIEKGVVKNIKKITSNNYIIAIINDYLKVIDCSINTTNNLITYNDIFKFYNVDSVCIIDDNNLILGYGNSVIKHSLEVVNNEDNQ